MRTRQSRIAWAVLLTMSVLWALNHLVGAFAFSGDVSPVVFVLFAVVDLAAAVVLWFPYRRRLWWAWLLIWVEVATIASTFFWADREVGIWYGAAALVMAAAQLVTRGEFRPAGSAQPVRNR